MNLSTRARRTVTAATLAAVTLGIAGPAYAERVALPDPEDVSGASLSDITRVVADHRATVVFVKVKFVELKPNSDAGPSSLSIFVDTNATKRGPEFRLGTGLQAGSDYQLVRMKDWRPVGGALSCGHALDIDFAKNRVTARMGRGCLGTPAEVRVGAKMVDLYDGSHPVTDWLKKPRGWTRWLAAA